MATEKLGAILKDLLKRTPALAKPSRHSKVIKAWIQVAGPEVAAHTAVRGLRRGLLTISVDSPPLCHDLASFRREELLAALNTELQGAAVQALHFRLGAI